MKPLTPKELEVIDLIASGHQDGQIAKKLQISRTTVRDYTKAILRKLHAMNRTHAAALYAARSRDDGTRISVFVLTGTLPNILELGNQCITEYSFMTRQEVDAFVLGASANPSGCPVHKKLSDAQEYVAALVAMHAAVAANTEEKTDAEA